MRDLAQCLALYTVDTSQHRLIQRAHDELAEFHRREQHDKEIMDLIREAAELIRTKWLDPRCRQGCQSLVLRDEVLEEAAKSVAVMSCGCSFRIRALKTRRDDDEIQRKWDEAYGAKS